MAISDFLNQIVSVVRTQKLNEGREIWNENIQNLKDALSSFYGEKGVPGGLATLDEDGKIPTEYVPGVGPLDPADLPFGTERLSFNTDGDAYASFEKDIIINSTIERGEGTVSYALSTDATATTNGTFTDAGDLPISVAAGNVLRVSTTGITTYKTIVLAWTDAGS